MLDSYRVRPKTTPRIETGAVGLLKGALLHCDERRKGERENATEEGEEKDSEDRCTGVSRLLTEYTNTQRKRARE